jgi:hypothetical protein
MNPELPPFVSANAIFPHLPAVVTPQLASVVQVVPSAMPSFTATQTPLKAFSPSTISSASGYVLRISSFERQLMPAGSELSASVMVYFVGDDDGATKPNP